MAWHSSNTNPPLGVKQNNAYELWRYVQSRNGSKALAAALSANAEVESYLNPGVYQGLNPSMVGYGLFQWDKHIFQPWCTKRGLDYSDGNVQMGYMYDETTKIGQWFNVNATAANPSAWLGQWYMPWKDFLAAKKDHRYLAGVFICSYERPKSILYGDRAQQEKAIRDRQNLADYWYKYFNGEKPPIYPEYGWEFLDDIVKMGVYATSGKSKNVRKVHK